MNVHYVITLEAEEIQAHITTDKQAVKLSIP